MPCLQQLTPRPRARGLPPPQLVAELSRVLSHFRRLGVDEGDDECGGAAWGVTLLPVAMQLPLLLPDADEVATQQSRAVAAEAAAEAAAAATAAAAAASEAAVAAASSSESHAGGKMQGQSAATAASAAGAAAARTVLAAAAAASAVRHKERLGRWKQVLTRILPVTLT